jgi:hypothetical protein
VQTSDKQTTTFSNNNKTTAQLNLRPTMSLNNATAANTAKKSSNLPFYEPVSPLPTSSQIIKEAREKLHETKRSNTVSYAQEAAGLIRTINSTRPFTPREDKRTLFGPKSTRPINERPPSSFL